MKQTQGYSRYFATFLISTTMMVIGMDTNKTGLQTKVSAKVSKETAVSNMGSLPVYFEENKGQFNEKVRYFTRGTSGYSLFLTATDAVYVLSSKEQKIERKASNIAGPEKPTTEFEAAKPSKAVAVYMSLEGANQNSEWSGLQPLEHCTNYFQGSDESKWQTDIPNYQSVRTNQIYEGIGMVWHGREKGAVQYDFVVQPNANPNQIEWKIQGAKAVELTTEGHLLIRTEFGDIKQNKPFTYQETNGFRREVESGYIVEADATGNEAAENSFRVKFDLGHYNPDSQLIIDPTVNLSNLAFSTFLGGSDLDYGISIAVDAAGHVYVTGQTRSTTFPTTPGTFDTTLNQFDDVFVTKLNNTGSSLIYSTFLGGSGFDQGRGIAVDSSGNVLVTGNAELATVAYPTTAGAFDTTHNGTNDVFVTKLNATGSALVYSTFIGGIFVDYGEAIAVDSSGNAFVTGPAYYDNVDPPFPTTPGAFDTTPNGDYDVFVTKLNATGSALVYSTFIGGSSYDIADGIAVDPSGSAFLTGHTNSDNYPTTAGAFDTTYNINVDVFVTKLNPEGSALTYSTFIGGNAPDIGLGITINSAGNAFLTGYTFGSDYPTTPGAYDRTQNGGNDAFVTSLNSEGSSLRYSTFIGGNGEDRGYSIALDSAENAFLTGRTMSAGYPTTPGAYDTSHNGFEDVFVTRLNTTGSTLVYSTFLGGSSNETGRSIALDSSGNAFVTGETNDATTDYPTTAGAFDTSHNDSNDVFVSKLNVNTNPPAKFDFDGDGKSDLSVYRPSEGNWYLLRSTEGFNITSWGLASDIVAPGDFDGDGKADFSVFRPSEGNWYIANSGGTFTIGQFGLPGDIPVPADYDGDGKDDRAVFRPSNSTWYILNSNGLNVRTQAFGLADDRPVPGDYDGDLKADLSVFRPSNGTWYRANSGNGSFFEQQWGLSRDIPVPADYDGDDRQDLAVFRPSEANWYILNSTNGSFNFRSFGLTGDVPVPGDYDGNGLDDIAVFRNGLWYIIRSAESYSVTQFGLTGDIAIPAK